MGQNQTKQREIAGTTYEVHYLDPDTALDIAVDLQGMIVPALAEILGKDDATDAELQGAVAVGLREFVASTDKAKVKRVVHTMLAKVFAHGTGLLDRETAQQHFLGRPAHMIKVVIFAVEVNFSDFFDELSGIRTWATAKLAGAGADPSNSPEEPAGTSGG